MNRKRLLGCDATIFVSNVDMIAKGKLEGGAAQTRQSDVERV